MKDPMPTIQYNTPAEYRAASVLSLCYSDDQIQPLCGVPLLDALLSIPGADACWFLAGALPQARRVEWAEACARRAEEYAARASAAYSAAACSACSAAYSARYAADAAADAYSAAYSAACSAYSAAYSDAYSDAVRKAEYHTSVRHGVLLLEAAILRAAREAGGR